mmetsp:Transcript_8341/g.12143  ORF Transcript_8341/g.12143 Transcript_8341/m.12143 type:complete len:920 (+) Transcript_8341:32-2791(+)
MSTNDSDTNTSTATASLPALLAALAEGARATNSLPAGTTKLDVQQKTTAKDSSVSSSDDDDGDDEFSFQMAFSEFRSKIGEARKRLGDIVDAAMDVTCNRLHHPDGTSSSTNNTSDLLTRLLLPKEKQLSTRSSAKEAVDWDKCGDVCDSLLEEIERYILDRNSGDGVEATQPTQSFGGGKQQQQHSFRNILSKVRSMEKPQTSYNFDDEQNVNNRTTAFVPRLISKPFAIVPFTLQSLPGHGLYLNNNLSEEEQSLMVAPKEHYAHPYETEIRHFSPCDWQLKPPLSSSSSSCELTWSNLPERGVGGTLKADPKETILPNDATFIDTEEALCNFARELEVHNIREVAIDLEAHSYRSFLGFVCLMQISVRWPPSASLFKNDVIIDTLALRPHLGPLLLPIFANPSICKIMHGADSDVIWLQRDFGIYVVNLFDTHQAAIELSLPSRSLASLLKIYAGVTVDKTHQLSDWRERPLPKDMLQYAQSDTHYLIDIYDCMRRDLVAKDNEGIQKVVDKSRLISLRRCSTEPFHPLGWKKLLRAKKGKHAQQLSKQQERCLSLLWDWRDAVARKHDESAAFVCQNHSLVRIAHRQPKSVSELARLLNPLPELVREYAPEIIDFVQQSGRSYTLEREVASSDTQEAQEDFDFLPNSGPSLSLQNTQIPISNTNEQESDTDDIIPLAKRRRILEINPCNAGFICTKYTPHSLELGALDQQGRGVTVDGMGAMKTVLDNCDKTDAANKEMLESIKIAEKIRYSLERNKNLLNLACTKFLAEENNVSTEKPSTVSCDEDSTLKHEEDMMPMSLKEEYNISDRILPSNSKSSDDRSHQKKDKSISKTIDDKSLVEPYDYSKSKSIGVLNSNAGLMANPFFSGAAVSSTMGKQKSIGTMPNAKGQKSPKPVQEQRASGEKSFVYRSSGR